MSTAELSLPLSMAIRGFQEWSHRLRQLAPASSIEPVLNHASSTVPYYRGYFGGRAESSLDRFPLLDRRKMIDEGDAFLSEAYLSDKNLYWKPTSGTSSGVPLVVRYDLASFYELCYVTYGVVARDHPDVLAAVPPGGLGVVLITNHPQAWRASTILPSLKFASLERYVIGRGAQEDCELVINLRRSFIPILCGTPSYLLELAEADDITSPGHRISPRMILVFGENLFDNSREQIERWFRAPVFNAYTSSEGGLVAMECPFRSGLHVRSERVHLEILDSHDGVTEFGSGEIVLTNLTNWLMPFIRYRTGDHGTLQWRLCACGFEGPTLVDLPSREAVYFELAAGMRLNTRELDCALSRVPFDQFQLVQLDRGSFLMRFVLKGDEPSPELERAVINLLHSILPKASIQIERVARIGAPGQKTLRYTRRSSAA